MTAVCLLPLFFGIAVGSRMFIKVDKDSFRHHVLILLIILSISKEKSSGQCLLCAGHHQDFSALPGAIAEGFQLQLQALESLARFGVKVHPALMVSLSSPVAIDAMKKRSGNIHRDFADFEIEKLFLYGDLEDRLIKTNLLH